MTVAATAGDSEAARPPSPAWATAERGAPVPEGRDSPGARMMPISAPTATTVPSGTRIFPRTPASDAGSSTLILSVMISTTVSSLAMRSPSDFIQWPTVPSTTLSPICGITIGVGINVSFSTNRSDQFTRLRGLISLIRSQFTRLGGNFFGIGKEIRFHCRCEWHRRNIETGQAGDRGIQVVEDLLHDHRRDLPPDASSLRRLVHNQGLPSFPHRL